MRGHGLSDEGAAGAPWQLGIRPSHRRKDAKSSASPSIHASALAPEPAIEYLALTRRGDLAGRLAATLNNSLKGRALPVTDGPGQ